VDIRVLCNFFFDGPRYQLFYFLCFDSGPGSERDRDAHREVGIFPLRHRVVSIPSPQDRAYQENPRDLPVLKEETSGIVSLLDDVCIGSMSHMPLSHK
jgi:hypothetical protein